MADDVATYFETEKKRHNFVDPGSLLPDPEGGRRPRLACKGKHFEVPKQRSLALMAAIGKRTSIGCDLFDLN